MNTIPMATLLATAAALRTAKRIALHSTHADLGDYGDICSALNALTHDMGRLMPVAVSVTEPAPIPTFLTTEAA